MPHRSTALAAARVRRASADARPAFRALSLRCSGVKGGHGGSSGWCGLLLQLSHALQRAPVQQGADPVALVGDKGV